MAQSLRETRPNDRSAAGAGCGFAPADTAVREAHHLLQRQQRPQLNGRTELQQHSHCVSELAPLAVEKSAQAKKLDRVLAFHSFTAATTAAAEAERKKRVSAAEELLAIALTAFGIRTVSVKHITVDEQRRTASAAGNGEEDVPSEETFLLFMAIFAEGCRRYEEADVYLLQLLVSNALREKEITSEQQQCVNKVFSRRLRHRRIAWKQLCALEKALNARHSSLLERIALLQLQQHQTQQVQQAGRSALFDDDRLALALCEQLLQYKADLREAILQHCYGVIWTVTHLMEPFAASFVAKVFVHKTIAMAYQQATQFTNPVPQLQCLQLARFHYEAAVALAQAPDSNMGPCDMMRLETLLSWVNFLFYTAKEQGKALKVAREVVELTIHALSEVKDENVFKAVVDAVQTLMRSIPRWMEETRKDAVFDWWIG